jgi:hypothetical protein
VTSSNQSTDKIIGDVRTALYVHYDTFMEINMALGFMNDDNECYKFMTESTPYKAPHQMRATFVIVLVFNEVGGQVGIFDKHQNEMAKYFVHRLCSEDHALSEIKI